jgi:hypothetical protein
MIKRFLSAAVLTTLCAGLPATPLDARSWRSTPSDKARNYAQILDQRSAREMVLVFWLTDRMLKDTPQNQRARALLTRNKVVGVLHADISTGGLFSYRDAKPPVLEMKGIGSRQSIDPDRLEPTVAGAITSIQQVFSRALGPLGRGIKWYVFKGEGIESCGSGTFYVNFADERYSYDLPIPGC